MRRVLVVEDGREYVEAFVALAGGSTRERGSGAANGPDGETDSAVTFERAGDAAEAALLLRTKAFDAVFLDLVFDRTPPDRLAGDAAALIARFGGDRARATRHLAEHQGFYVLDALLPHLPDGVRVVLAHDLESEPMRFAALRERVAGLVGLPEGASAAEALRLLLY